jgi:hypothetical protein
LFPTANIVNASLWKNQKSVRALPIDHNSSRRRSGLSTDRAILSKDRVEDRFMGRKPKNQKQLKELSEGNRRLREFVAYLSWVVLSLGAETNEPAKAIG